MYIYIHIIIEDTPAARPLDVLGGEDLVGEISSTAIS